MRKKELGSVADRIKDTTSAVRSSARRLTSVGTRAAEQGSDRIRTTASGLAAGAIETAKSLPDYARNLDWNTLDPTPYLHAGTRGIGRGTEEARLVWESIPEHLRALGPDAVKARLDGFHWSHIIPHSQGGGSEAANGVFEQASLNWSRGAVPMTPDEITAAESVLSAQAFQATLEEAASRVVTGAACGAAISLVLAILEYSLAYQRGAIAQREMYRRIGRDVARSTAVAATIPAIVTPLVLKFPILIPIAMPLLVLLAAAGLCVVGGKIYRLGKGWHELRQDRMPDRGRDGSVSA